LKSIEKFNEVFGNQFGNPRGILGMYTGEMMVKQHKTETQWTIMLLDLQQNETILELGCGAGYAMKLLLELPVVSHIVGLDISKSILHSATIRNRKEINSGRATLVQKNVKHLDFQDEHFTKVYSIHSVYFWDDLPKTISDIYRILKPEGTIVITLSDGKNNEISPGITDMIQQQVIPIMEQTKFKNIEILEAPNSRGYHIVSIKGKKPSQNA